MELKENFEKDVQDVQKIEAMPVLLNVISQTTGMGFVAVARVTESRWITCSVLDKVAFGLKPGDELQIKTTICNEVRDLQKAIVIDHVAEDADFCDHPTPAMYGFQSYISVPIVRKDGSFFGTLCAIDAAPRLLKNDTIRGMFKLFAELISFHLNAADELEQSKFLLENERTVYLRDQEAQKVSTAVLEKMVKERTHELTVKNGALEKANLELESFAFISSHDLQEPLRKIMTYSDFIIEKEKENLTETGKANFQKIINSASRMRSLITDLLSYARTSLEQTKFENIRLDSLLEEVKEDLQEEFSKKQTIFETGLLPTVRIIPFQFRQLLYNLFTNSIKFSKPDSPLILKINSKIVSGSEAGALNLAPDLNYHRITIVDNGLGFDDKYSDQIFKLFQRLHINGHYPGTGIGLAIVKKIVNNHSGSIKAKSKVDEGTLFDIYIPV